MPQIEYPKLRRKLLNAYAIIVTVEGDFLYFEYDSKEIEYLKSRDDLLGAEIDRIGHIYRVADNDLYSSVVHHIIGQQISTRHKRQFGKG